MGAWTLGRMARKTNDMSMGLCRGPQRLLKLCLSLLARTVSLSVSVPLSLFLSLSLSVCVCVCVCRSLTRSLLFVLVCSQTYSPDVLYVYDSNTYTYQMYVLSLCPCVCVSLSLCVSLARSLLFMIVIHTLTGCMYESRDI